MAEALKVALVGCGGMTAHYLSVYRDVADVRVVRSIDTDAEAARRAAAVFAPAAEAGGDFAGALQADIDAVVISTPNHLHRPQAVAAIEARKHVLLQKPVAANLDDAQAIARAAEASSRTVGLYMSYLDQPLVHDLRDMIARGWFGEPVHFYARLMHKGGMMWSAQALAGNRTWRGSIEQTGGGCFIQLAVHYLHIFEWISGAKVISAAGFTNRLHCPGLEGEDIAVGVFQMDSGAMITIDTAWCAHGEELAVRGTRGRVEYRNNRWLAAASSAGEYRGRVVQYNGGLTEAFGGSEGAEQQMEIVPPAFGDAANPLNQHRMFLEAARAGKPAYVSIESGVDDMRIVAALYEAARTGRTVAVAR